MTSDPRFLRKPQAVSALLAASRRPSLTLPSPSRILLSPQQFQGPYSPALLRPIVCLPPARPGVICQHALMLDSRSDRGSTMRPRPVSAAVLCAALLMTLAGCETTKSETPLSPSIAGPIAGVEITAPRLLQPGQGTKLKESQQPITLLVENS